MKVFVSSTVYDLIDIRAEVSGLLTSMGIAPVLSDDKLSEFDTAHATNSIETCLINVKDSDEVIVILDQRYGPRLGKLGFENISATHLEYNRARELKKPIHVFVRDRLEADFTTWKKNRKSDDLRLPWVDQADFGMFTLLDEHRKLSPTDDKNWFSTFATAIDLKHAIRRILEPRIKPTRIVDAISQNRFPLFSIDHDSEFMVVGNIPSVKLTISASNIGGSAAFNFKCTFITDHEKSEIRPLVAPGQVVTRVVIGNANYEPAFDGRMILEYDSVIGVRVKETYLVQAFIQGGRGATLFAVVQLKEKTYHNAPEIQVVITD
jgi:hypothetical protein